MPWPADHPRNENNHQGGPKNAAKFGDALEDISRTMLELAKYVPPSQLAAKAFGLYEKFRLEFPPGKKEGAFGKLDLDLIRKMASS